MARTTFTITSVPLRGKTVLVRADLNELVQHSVIVGDYRLRQLLPTLELLRERQCRIVIIGHRGRPRGPSQTLSLQPIAAHLAQLMGQPVQFVDAVVGPRVAHAVKQLRPGQMLMCENLRFDAREYRNDPALARQLVRDTRASYLVLESFGVLHRHYASIDAISQCVPVLPGLHVAREYRRLRALAVHSPRPSLAIIGGRDTDTKAAAMMGLLGHVDHIYVGGHVAIECIAYHRYPIGQSRVTRAGQAAIDRLYQLAARRVGFRDVGDVIRLPRDLLVQRGSEVVAVELRAVKPRDRIIDIGPQAAAEICDELATVKYVAWNGPVGDVATTDGLRASFAIMQAMQSRSDLVTAVLGGDTVRFVESFSPLDAYDIVSTGGAAALQLLAGQQLPGLDSLLDAPRRVVYTKDKKA